MSGASLTEVAKAGGVSLATASRVLNPDNTHPVSAEVRARVLAAAEELNFSVNALARGLKVKRAQTVAAIVHDFCDPYFNAVARGVTDAAEAAGYLTMLCNSSRDPDKELRYVQLAQQQRVAGVLFAGGGFASRRYRSAMSQQIATLRGYGAHAIALEPRGADMPAEIPDNRGGAEEATAHLVALGHRRIAFIDGPEQVLTSGDRLGGYRDGLEAAGLPFDEALVASGGFSETGGREALAAILDRAPGVTAVFASNDAMAIGCMMELRERGLAVPRDMSLVGFDDVQWMEMVSPAITVVEQPAVELGRRAAALLLRRIAEPDSAATVELLQPSLLIRGSTGEPRGPIL
jgi:LacI family transcriptional regulator